MRLSITEEVKNNIGAGYTELLAQVEEMYGFLVGSFPEDDFIIKELGSLPIFEEPSVFNQTFDELGYVGYAALIAPYLFIILLTAFFPLGIIFLVYRNYKKSKAIERLRELDGILGRLIFHLKLED